MKKLISLLLIALFISTNANSQANDDKLGTWYMYFWNTNLKVVLGYAHLTSGVLGDSKETFNENRIFQDINLPLKITERIVLNHRLR